MKSDVSRSRVRNKDRSTNSQDDQCIASGPREFEQENGDQDGPNSPVQSLKEAPRKELHSEASETNGTSPEADPDKAMCDTLRSNEDEIVRDAQSPNDTQPRTVETSRSFPPQVEESCHLEEPANDSDIEKSETGIWPLPLPTVLPSAKDAADLSRPDSHTSKDAYGNTYPEGGVDAWLCVLGSFCGLTAILGITNSLAVYQNYFVTHQLVDVPVGTVGWIFGLYTFIAFSGGIEIGPVFDAVGPRWLVFAGSLCTTAATLILGECQEFWHFMLTFGLLAGLGMSLVFTPAIASIGHYFLQRRGEATGIVATGGAFGGVMFPLILQALFPKIGFAWTTRVVSLINLVFLIAANLLIRSRLPKKRPSKENILPDFRIFRDPVFTLTTAGVFFGEWGLFVPLSYISSYAVANGVNEALAYQLLAIFNVGSLFGRWLPGYLADRVGRFNSMLLFSFLCLVCSVALWLPAKGSVPLLVIMCLAFGFASGSNISLTPVCVGQLCKTENYGRYYASAFTIVSFGCLTCAPIGGQIISACGGKYWGLVTFAACSYAASLGCFAFARGLGGGWKPRTVF